MSELDRLTQIVAGRAAGLKLYARGWVDVSSADDVVQEALTALLVQRPAPDDPVAWMYRTVRNRAIDFAKAAARRRRREQAVAESRRELFEDRADAAIDAKAAERALAQLADEQRQIVVLRIWGQLGFLQIADIVGKSVSTVHERYTAALAQMRSQLEKPCKNETN